MIRMDKLLDMVATEALEQGNEEKDLRDYQEYGKDLPPIRFNLELIESPNGELYWIE